MRVINNAKGFGLLDVMLALSVSAVVLVLAVAYYSNAATSQKINRTIQQIEQIQTVVQNQIQENIAQAKPATFAPGINLTPTLVSKNLISSSTVTSVWDKSQMQISTEYGSVSNNAGKIGSKVASTVACVRINIIICGVSPGAVNKLSNRYMATFVESSPAETTQNKCMVFSSCLG